MRRALVAFMLVGVLAGCSSLRSAPKQDFFVLFFSPGTADLTPEAQQIVRQAAANAMDTTVMRIEIAVPTQMMARVALAEGRFTAVQNILSVSGLSPAIFAHVPMSANAAALPGAADRAEIHLISPPPQ